MDVSEKTIVFIFGVNEYADQTNKQTACSTCSLTLKMESIHSYETSVNFYQNKGHHIIKDSILLEKVTVLTCLDISKK